MPAARPSRAVLAFLVVLTALVAACDLTRTASEAPVSVGPAGPAVTATPSPSATTTASPTAASPSPSPTPAEGQTSAGIPTACLNLGPIDCQRAGDTALGLVDTAGAPVIYLQVGPFGCVDVERCPATLEARPEGDVTVELDGAPGVAVRVRSVGGAVSGEISESFGVVLEPTPGDPLEPGPRPFELGHCGILGGFDVGGSWWDPVGSIDADHPDAINAAAGTLTVEDADSATFVSRGGLTVRLERRDGPKLLPLCQ